MRIRQLGSTISDTEFRQHLTTFVINDTIAVDAGSLGLMGPVADQRLVKHVILSHSHIDHIATLPLFLDNVFSPDDECPTIYANKDVWFALTHDVLNERLWPDLSRISSDEINFYREFELCSEVSLQLEGLTITPVAVDHIVPTLGFLIEDKDSAVIIASDTGPTQRIWELAGRPDFRKKLRAVFLECSFSNSHEWLAQKSKHLCPRLFAEEIAKVPDGGPFLTVAVHLKATMYERTAEELQAFGFSNFVIGGKDQTWDF